VELTLFLDHQCNLRCTYCYGGRKFARRMSESVMRQAVDMALARERQHLDVALFGGEPLLCFDLIRAAADYVERELRRRLGAAPTVRWLLNTNGTLFTDEILEWFAPPRSSILFVSLDGPRELHDRHRKDPAGQGSYDRVVDGLAELGARGIEYQLVAVVNASTVGLLGEVAAELLRHRAHLAVLSPNFRDAWRDDALGELNRGFRDAARVWADELSAGRACPLDPLHTKILTHLKGGIPCPSRCVLGGEELAVAPSGRIYPCAQMIQEDASDDLVIGRVDQGLDWAKIRRLQAEKDRVEATCAPCALRDRCQSHCGCRHLGLSGRLGTITATLCELEAAAITAADQVATRLYEEQCETFLDLYYRTPWVAPGGSRLARLRRSRDSRK
jgi:uncharacterized protein